MDQDLLGELFGKVILSGALFSHIYTGMNQFKSKTRFSFKTHPVLVETIKQREN